MSTAPTDAAAESASTPPTGETLPGGEVFISPRVIDREAFNDYSRSLRRIIDESTRQAESLRVAAAEALAAQNALRETAARHQGRFDGAARALNAIDAKVAAAERLLSGSEQARRDAEGVRQAAERATAALNEAVEQARTDLAAHAEGLKERLTAAIDGATESVRRAEHGSTEAVMNLVGAAERKLAQVEARLIEFKPRAIAPLQTGDPATLERLEKLLVQLRAEREAAEQRAVQLREAAVAADKSRQSLVEMAGAAGRQLEVTTATAQAVSTQTQQVVVRLARIVEAIK